MNILSLMILFSCKEEKCDLFFNDGIYLIYDERYCEKCRLTALSLVDSLVKNEIEYYLISINTISKRKTELEFREFAPIQIYYAKPNDKNCLIDFPEISLIYKNSENIRLLTDLTK
ncbi:hypothetical protein [Algoriphagus taiwanensis]|uniref:Lipoprotein n=1 Tax=Algoriphagus taiwanensis TaxID=1445656 RepID=A0ABQ6Q631_9BACT|nr:hypothetical protein Ataiwa_39120 [Algoriphagus taiwanensis]